MDEDHLTPEEAALLTEIRTRRRKLIATHRRNKSAANNTPVMPRTVDATRSRTTENLKVCGCMGVAFVCGLLLSLCLCIHSTAHNTSISHHPLCTSKKKKHPTLYLTTSTPPKNDKQASMASMGLDGSAAVQRARTRSLSRVGRKRTRSESRGPGGLAGDAMEGVEGGVDGQPPAKRVHSSKSRSMSRGRVLSMAEPRKGSGLKDIAQKVCGGCGGMEMGWWCGVVVVW